MMYFFITFINVINF